MTPFHLTAEAAATAAAKAYRDGRLGFQRGHRECLYRYDDGGCCAIGAGIPDDAAAAGQQLPGTAIGAVIAQGIVSSDNDGALCRLQFTHDELCPGWGRSPTPRGFNEFLRAVNENLPASVPPITADEWADCPAEWRAVA